MDGFYVFGGGMGHLSRVKKFISHQKIRDFKIFTGNPLVDRFFESEQILLFRQGDDNVKEALEQYLRIHLQGLYFDNFYIDCFPAGILYELTDEFINAGQIHYLTRHVKEKSYQFDRVAINFETCIALEELSKDQVKFLKKRNIPIKSLRLPTPNPNPNETEEVFKQCFDKPRWLIVHSSNIEETELLILKANQLAEVELVRPQIFLISDNNSEMSDVYWIKNEMNPVKYFPHADKIFSGGGFNMIHELDNYQEKHICLPFPRKYDDQEYRLKNKEVFNT